MFTNEVIGGICGGVLSIAGLLLVMSSMKQRRVDWRIGTGVPLFGLGLFILVTDLPRYALGFSVLATLSMAFAAFLNIRQSADREERDRKERRLIALIEWANAITKCETAAPLPPLPVVEIAKNASKLGKAKIDTILEYRNININTNLIMRYDSLDIMGNRMVLIANTLDKQFSCNLGGLAKDTADKLQAHVDELGPKFIRAEVTDEEYKVHWKSLISSAKSLAEKAEEAMD